MVIDVHTTLRRCVSCAKDRIDLREHTNLLKLLPAHAPLESVALDLLGPLPKLKSGYRIILVMVEHFAKLSRFKALRFTTAPKLAKAFCEEWVFTYGPPKKMLTDNGHQLRAKFIQEKISPSGCKGCLYDDVPYSDDCQTERFFLC